MLRLLIEHPRTTEVLVQLFSTSQHFSELMIRDPALLDWLRGGAEPRDRDALIDDLWDELAAAAGDEEAERLAIRRFRQREMLRIGYDDIVRGLPLEVTTLDLSYLADACVEAACRLARRRAEERHGVPQGRDGKPARFVVLALGKLGGGELNYSSDIDLIFLYDDEGQTDRAEADLQRRVLRPDGGRPRPAPLRPHRAGPGLPRRHAAPARGGPGGPGPLARGDARLLRDVRPDLGTPGPDQVPAIAGDLDLGRTFLDAITPFVYRRYLSGAEIGEIKAMKRRIEQRTVSAGTAEVEVKTGRGGIRDVEFVVQFLQLLHGGQYPEVRHRNTLTAISRLEQVGCLTAEERSYMEDTYRFLRRVEHRLQIMFDRQTHQMPRDLEEQRILAIRMGYPPASPWEDRTGPRSGS